MKNTIKLIFISVLVAFTAACNNSEPEIEDTTNQIAKEPEPVVQVEMNLLEEKDEDCSTENCTEVVLNYPQISSGNSKLDETVNDYVINYMSFLFKENLTEPTLIKEPQRMAESFIEGYKMFKMEFPDMNVPWFIKVDGSEVYETSEYFTLVLIADIFTGGNHPNRFANIKSYNLQTGDTASVLNSIENPENFKLLVEKKFRKEQGLTETESLTEAGYFFEDDIFTLPENMGFVPGGILFYYNPYEAGPYSFGTIRFIIKDEEINSENAVV